MFGSVVALAVCSSFGWTNNAFASGSYISLEVTGESSISLESGVFGQETQSITSSTTNYSGYTLSIKNEGVSTDLVNVDDNSKVIPTISLPSGKTSLLPSEFGVGYGYSKDATNFRPIPGAGTSETLLSASSASQTSDLTNLTFGVRVDNSVSAGMYIKEFVIVALANPAPYTITFDENTTDTVTNMPSPISGVTEGTSVILPSNVPVRYGYKFLGWSLDNFAYQASYSEGDSFVIDRTTNETVTLYAIWEEVCPAEKICYSDNGANSSTKMGRQTVSSQANATLWASNFQRDGYGFAGWNTKMDGSGVQYGPNQTIAIGDVSSEGIWLYANWIQSEGDYQNWNGCPLMEIGEMKALTDSRDNKTYALAKLADDSCWMIENLRLSSNATINADNTNNPASGFVLASSTSQWCTDSTDSCLNQSLVNTVNTTSTVSSMTATNQNIYSYGNYYNWYSATAGNGTVQITTNNETVDGDICPAGWHLPIGGDSTSANTRNFYLLGKALTGVEPNVDTGNNRPYYSGVVYYNTFVEYPNNFITGGQLNSTVNSKGAVGVYWSATNSAGQGLAYRLNMDARSYSVEVNSHNNKYNGYNVRCTIQPSFVVEFDANGGHGTMNPQTIKWDVSTNLQANSFTHDDFVFLGWNTKPDGTGSHYANMESVRNIAPKNEEIILYAEWGEKTCAANTICYSGDGADDGISMGDQTRDDTEPSAIVNVASNTDIVLWAQNFKRAGYGFAGWNTRADGQGANYGPNEKIRLGDVSSAGLHLFANWVASTGDLQNWNGCNAMSVGDVTALTDNRDGNTYAVAKHADGNCWMMENLRLNNTATITAENTNHPVGGFALAAPTNSWCSTADANCINRTILNDTNVANAPAIMTTGRNVNVYGYGNYYNWHTATAGNGLYAMTSGNTYGDICPKGWQLPKGGTSVGSFGALANAMSGGNSLSSWMKYPLNFVYSGGHSGSSTSSRGKSGFYFTATATGSNSVNRLQNEAPSTLNYGGTTGKNAGRTVRCLTLGT